MATPGPGHAVGGLRQAHGHPCRIGKAFQDYRRPMSLTPLLRLLGKIGQINRAPSSADGCAAQLTSNICDETGQWLGRLRRVPQACSTTGACIPTSFTSARSSAGGARRKVRKASRNPGRSSEDYLVASLGRIALSRGAAPPEVSACAAWRVSSIRRPRCRRSGSVILKLSAAVNSASLPTAHRLPPAPPRSAPCRRNAWGRGVRPAPASPAGWH